MAFPFRIEGFPFGVVAWCLDVLPLEAVNGLMALLVIVCVHLGGVGVLVASVISLLVVIAEAIVVWFCWP